MGTKKRIQYRSDKVGNKVGLTDPDGGRFTYAYDKVNRLTEVVNPQADRTTFAYNAVSRRTKKLLANGARTSFSFDNAGRITRVAHLKSDATPLSSFDYRYDKAGHRIGMSEADGSRVTWLYDNASQLTGEHRTGTNAYRHTFTYDRAGNRTLKNEDGQRTTFSYDAANQMEYAEAAAGRTTYVYDADGNQQIGLLKCRAAAADLEGEYLQAYAKWLKKDSAHKLRSPKEGELYDPLPEPDGKIGQSERLPEWVDEDLRDFHRRHQRTIE